MDLLLTLSRFTLLVVAITTGSLYVKEEGDTMTHFYCALSTAAFAWSMGWI